MRVLICSAVLFFSLSQAGSAQTQTPSAFGRTNGYSNPAMRYFAGSRTQTPPTQTARRQPAAIQTVATSPARPQRKPFSNVTQQSNISPYLALDYQESEFAIPNYYAYVRPQLQQRQRQQRQTSQIRNLQNEVRQVAAPPGAPSATDGVANTGHATQFLNVGGYYPPLR
ncbi:hypothetical protein [Adhaeretor mobilis]|uniref:Uncharacterized protein n=1 Tax=Adhaeretor mobilis TaxID=1930276 RepID=A0A517MR27_9BACT|nr:hypothetical protein [Adhaeretor mobilis]QDS97329.1 hypothetical protein HG15A2_05900 [Adhaeretor mobilis]